MSASVIFEEVEELFKMDNNGTIAVELALAKVATVTKLLKVWLALVEAPNNSTKAVAAEVEEELPNN